MAAANLDDLVADVTQQTSVVQSVVTLLSGLAAQLQAAIAANDPVKIQAVADAMTANTDTLAAAVSANTPAALAAKKKP